MIDTPRPRFELGQVVATPGAIEALEASGQSAAVFLAMHASGDWGEVCGADWKANDEALRDGNRILSSYLTSNGTEVWIITEATDDEGRRASTCILLPEEY